MAESSEEVLRALREHYFGLYTEDGYERARNRGDLDAASLRADLVTAAADLGVPEPGTTPALIKGVLDAVADDVDWEHLLGLLDWDLGYGGDR